MAKEAVLLILRRFMQRILESGLLVIAVALGIGSASAGIALNLNIQANAKKMLESPEYREIVVSTQSDIEGMDQAAVKRAVRETAILTISDLDVASMLPDVAYAYLSNETQLRFINRSFLDRQNSGGPEAGGAGGPPGDMMGGPPDEGPGQDGPEADFSESQNEQDRSAPSPQENSDAALQSELPSADAAKADSASREEAPDAPREGRPGMDREALLASLSSEDVFLPDVESLKGFEVSPEFFDAWKFYARLGSLFTEEDQKSGANYIVLGSEAAKTLAGDQCKPEELIGKKLLVFQEYRTVTGILAPSGLEKYDNSFYTPARIWTSSDGRHFPRFESMNTRLRFTVSNPDQLNATAALLQSWFDEHFEPGQIVISNPRVEALKLIKRNQGISLLILFLSLAGLFIASVNVSNMLMSRGLRMRRNTGILMALGASRNNIVALFGLEALMIACVGAILGALLGLPLLISMQTALSLEGNSFISILPGVLLSLFLVLVFSLLPAWQNSRVFPADAMRAV